MQYSPKLKIVMQEIKDVLKKHDVAAFVLLHTPGFTEYLNKVNPSYSCASLDENGEFRVRLKSSELPEGKAEQLATDTYNMVTLMADVLALHAGGYIDLHNMLKEKWGGEDGDWLHTSHTTQNT